MDRRLLLQRKKLSRLQTRSKRFVDLGSQWYNGKTKISNWKL